MSTGWVPRLIRVPARAPSVTTRVSPWRSDSARPATGCREAAGRANHHRARGGVDVGTRMRSTAQMNSQSSKQEAGTRQLQHQTLHAASSVTSCRGCTSPDAGNPADVGNVLGYWDPGRRG